jgi:hypothetical protein
MSKSKFILMLLACITIGTMAVSAVWADTASINPSDDSYVKTNQPDNNFGSEEVLTVKSQVTGPQNWRALLRFDLSSIPVGSTINGASLSLYMEIAAGSSRNYELYYGSNDSWTEGAVTYNSAFTAALPAPGLTSLLDTIPTGTSAASLTWGKNGPNSATESLTSRVDLELNGIGADKIISLIIKDQTESNSPNRLASFTSKDTTTTNAKPVLVVDYTPPVACEEATLELKAFNLYTGDMPIPMFTEVCFDVEYQIKAGCKDLSYVKTQGGFGGNLDISDISVSKGDIDPKEVGNGNIVVTWTIPDGLVANEPASLYATVCTGTNPAGKQEFTSCGFQPITGQWSSTAVVAEDGSIIESTPLYTDSLMVEVSCK